jgi:tetratricopeptide (TPR) repeat protein
VRGSSREPVPLEGPAFADPGGLRAARPEELRDPSDLYLAGEFERSRDAFRRLLVPGLLSGTDEAGRDLPGEETIGQASVLYGLARCEYALGRIREARSVTERLLDLLECLEGRAGAVGLVDPADLGAYAITLLSDIALSQKRPVESLALLDRLRHEGFEGRAGSADEMLFRRAAALEAAGRTREARKAFRRLAATWPDGPLADEALTRAGNIGRPFYEARAGVFEARPSAEARVRALRERGFVARVEVQAGPAEGRFVVSLGRFARREDAERAKGQAESEGFDSDISVRVAP